MVGRTILSVGSNPVSEETRSGFTLFEIVVAVVILSVGIVAIYEALIVSVNGFSYYSNALTVQSWMGRKLWEARPPS